MTLVTSEELLALATEVGEHAGIMLMDRPATFEISSKSVAIDIATQMDKASEKYIVEAILAKRPMDGIIGEEGSERQSQSGITWVIDPVDGTVNYLYGIPGWSISIAAKDEHGVLAGIVHAPSISSTWTALQGGGAWFNGSSISVNDPVELDRALIGTGFAYDVRKRFEQGRVAADLLPQIRDLRRMGSAAVDICHVAMGRFDGYYESGLFEWDRAAASLIATEAGALFSTNASGVAFCAGPYLYPRLKAAVEKGA
ncbi:MAG: inositol monophosphatase family protein [Actinobacteria bacterium]|nr:inositol monophosphatase family protein [Actinomycetota bacterium]